MKAKNWKLYYKETEYKPLLEKVTDTIVLWSCIGLFWLSFFSMAGEIFPNYVPKGWGVYFGIALWQFVLWLFYEVIIPRTRKGKIRLQILLPGLHAVFILGIWLKNRAEITREWQYLISTYLKEYNSYYGTSYPLATGFAVNVSDIFLLLACIWWFLLWNLAYGLKKRWILIAFPIIVPLFQLYVGLSPKGIGVSCLFVGVLLMVALGTNDLHLGISYKRKNKKTGLLLQNLLIKGMAIFMILVSLLLSNVFYQDNMEELVTKKQEVLELQEDLGNRLTNFDFLGFVDVQLNREALTNNTPI